MLKDMAEHSEAGAQRGAVRPAEKDPLILSKGLSIVARTIIQPWARRQSKPVSCRNRLSRIPHASEARENPDFTPPPVAVGRPVVPRERMPAMPPPRLEREKGARRLARSIDQAVLWKTGDHIPYCSERKLLLQCGTCKTPLLPACGLRTQRPIPPPLASLVLG